MTNIRELVRKAQQGDAEAFSALFVQCEAELYRMAYVYVRHEQDALDVVQETAYRSFRGIRRLKEPNYFKTWLIRIAIGCSLDMLRRRKKLAPPARWPDEAGETGPGGAADRAEEEALAVSLSLQDVCERLDEREKGIIMLRYYQDFTIREAAEILDIPLGTAKTVLYRALGKLRIMLREEDGDE